jgi:hypothetical protein
MSRIPDPVDIDLSITDTTRISLSRTSQHISGAARLATGHASTDAICRSEEEMLARSAVKAEAGAVFAPMRYSRGNVMVLPLPVLANKRQERAHRFEHWSSKCKALIVAHQTEAFF